MELLGRTLLTIGEHLQVQVLDYPTYMYTKTFKQFLNGMSVLHVYSAKEHFKRLKDKQEDINKQLSKNNDSRILS